MVGRTQAQKQKARDAFEKQSFSNLKTQKSSKAKRRRERKKRGRGLIEEGIVEVKIEGKTYQLPFKQQNKKVLMITNNPEVKGGVLVWLKGEEKVGSFYGHNLIAHQAIPYKGKIEKVGGEAGYIYSFGSNPKLNNKKSQFIDVTNFFIKPPFRKKGLGTAIREIVLSKARRTKVNRVDFPKGLDHHPEFYKERGFNRDHKATPEQLNYTKNLNLVEWSKKLEEKGFKIYWAKSSKFKKK